MTPPVDDAISAKRKAAIEAALRDGFAPFGKSGGRGASLAQAAKALRIKQTALRSWLRRQMKLAADRQPNFVPDWTLWNRQISRDLVPAEPRQARRWLLTAAQNDTAIHTRFWTNLKAYAAAIGAQIIVGPFTYQLGVFEDHNTRNGVFAEAVRPHLRFERTECGDVLFCAEMNTLPTAVRPLSGLHSYTRGRWGVFPHAKIALETIPAMPSTAPAIIMTTGCCTVANYIKKKAGLKAEFHHVIGATLVEIDARGRHFCRQINATEDGAFQDLDCVVSGGKVTPGRRVAAINPGDIHRALLDPDVALGLWGLDLATGERVNDDNMIDVLRPLDQFFNDLFHGQAINHWQMDKPFKRYPLHVAGKLDVAGEARQAAHFLRWTQRSFCRSHVVESNHDYWISRWLQSVSYREDLTNVEAFHRWNLAALEAARRGETDFSVFRHVLREADDQELEGISFIPIGASFEICKDRGGIECGLHGHLGPNGSRGSTASLAKLSIKANKGHDHTATIMDGIYSAGVCGTDPDLRDGPSSHTKSHIITYPNAKRTIITMQGEAWRA